MKHFGNLSAESIQTTFVRMAERAIVAAYVQVFIFPIIVLTSVELRASPWMWMCEGILILGAISRTLHLHSGHKLFKYKNGILYWQIWFSFGAQAIAGVWGLSTAYVFSEYGLTVQAWSMLIICLGTLSLYAASYSFEIYNNLIFQTLILVPTMVVLAQDVGGENSYRLSLAGILFLIFSIMMAFQLRRIEFKMLKNHEDILEKDAELEKRHDEAIAMHNLIRAMLGSIDESFVMLDKNGICSNVASDNAKAILEIEPMGLHISDILRQAGKDKETLSEYYGLFFSTNLDFEDLSSRLPQQLVLNDGTKTLALKYHPMRNQDDELEYVILTARDVTVEIKAQMQIKSERERANMILRIHSNRPGFRSFLQEIDRLLNVMKTASAKTLEEVTRDLHTLKGTALIFGVNSVSKIIYEIELQLRASAETDFRKKLQTPAIIFENAILSWKNSEIDLFTQVGVFEGETFELSSRKLSHLKDKFKNDPGLNSAFSTITQSLLSNEFGELMEDFEFHVVNTAHKLGKNIEFQVETPDRPVFVSPLIYRETLRPLVHLLNNALDHGLESPQDRKKKGKSDIGHITIRYEMLNKKSKDWIRLQIADDGGGINISKLRSLLQKRGSTGVDGLTDLQVAMSIFNSGMSTRENISEISGQGVGMGSVSAAIKRAGGEIEITKTDEKGTVFEILLPYIPPTQSDQQSLYESSH